MILSVIITISAEADTTHISRNAVLDATSCRVISSDERIVAYSIDDAVISNGTIWFASIDDILHLYRVDAVERSEISRQINLIGHEQYLYAMM